MNPQMVIAVELERALQEKTARIAVVGLGHVGRPLAERFVAAGFDTVGNVNIALVIANQARLIVDTRNAFADYPGPHVHGL